MSHTVEIHSCSTEKSTMSFPLGALCIKTALNASGKFAKCPLFMHYTYDDPEEEALACASRNPQAVGISLYIWNYKWFEIFAETLKKHAPHIMIFAGGPWCSSYSADIPSYIQFAVTGEGDVTVVKCLEKWFEDGLVSGLINGELPDLSALESPFLTHQADGIIAGCDSVLWEMTRGCPFNCAFCFESRGIRKVRNFPMERIEAELQYLINRQICNVFVLDPTFNLDKDRAKAVLRLLLQEAPSYMHFTFEIRAELVDNEMAEMFAELNCSLQIGLQSSDSGILSEINRNFDSDVFSKHVKMLSRTGAAYGFDIIIGLPGDTLEKFRSTVNYAVSLMPSNIDCFVLSILPCTVLASKAEQYGYKTDGSAQNTVISSPTFSAQDIHDALEIKRAMDLFYTKGQACMWIHCILETLNITACNLFALFSKWFAQTGRSEDEDIWILQDDFVSSLFEKTRNTKLLGALKSFMELHQALCFVTDTGEPVEIDLNYTADDLSKLDYTSLSEFVKTIKMRRTHLIVDIDDCGIISLR